MKKPLLMTLGILLITAGPLVVLTGTVYTLMLPNMYVSSARISVSEPTPKIDPFADQKNYEAVYDPNFLRTQFEIIQSQPILYEVINRLNLQAKWGSDGERLPRNVALKILKHSITVFQQRDTSLIYISVTRDNPNEAAKIANELAETYRDARMEQMHREAREVIGKIQAVLKDQQSRVTEAEKKLAELGATNKTDQTYLKAQTDLESERFIYNQLNAKLRERIIMLEVPPNPVEIIDAAEPNMRPVSPNLFMNVLLSLALAAVPMGTGIVLLVVGSTGKSRL